MNEKVILVDIDITFVDTPLLWFNWCVENSNMDAPFDFEEKRTSGDVIPYDFSKLFTDINHADCLSFWTIPDLYDDLHPIPDAVSVLRELHEKHGYKIVFVSYVIGGNFDSKLNFLKRHVDFPYDVVITKSKYLIPADFIIDDRNEFLNESTARKRIKFNSPFEQFSELTEPVKVVHNWLQVLKYIKDTEKL